MAENNRGSEIKNKLAKGAATVAGGPVVGEAVDLAQKGKLGPSSVNKNADLLTKNSSLAKPSMPGSKQTVDDLPKEGLEDAENYGGTESAASKIKNKISEKGKLSATDAKGSADNASATSEKSIAKSFIQKHKFKIIAGIAGAFLSLFIMIIPILTISSAGRGVIAFFQDIGNTIVGFFQNDEFDAQEAMEDYYDELDNVKTKIYTKTKKNVCVDENLITATLTVDLDTLHKSEEGEEEAKEDPSDNEYFTDTVKQYKEMRKQVAILANMQIITKVFGNDDSLKDPGYPNPGDRCRPEGSGTETPLVTAENYENFDTNIFGDVKRFFNGDWKKEDLISDDINLVSQHDKGALFAFFSRKTNEEKNYEYHLYQPEAELQCVGQRRANGDCAGALQPVCNDKLPDDEYELSIGELNDMEQHVYYWNLVNQFIPDYYEEYLPDEDHPDYEKAVKHIAEQIYLLYTDLGKGSECHKDTSYAALSYSYMCPNGVPVKQKSGEVEFIPLEDYVAGVIAAENNWHQGDNIENMKAQAVAARTYAINATNSCQNPIDNSSAKQNYKTTTDPYAIKAAQETAGMVLNNNGVIFSTEYDAFCVDDVSNGVYTIKQKGQEIPKEFVQQMGSTYVNTDDCLGHGRGMSQIGARYLQSQGYTFEQILDYYYGDGTGIQTGSSSTGISLVNTGSYGDWASWKQRGNPWSDIKIGSKTIGDVGCLVTSIAILVAKSQVPTKVNGQLDPGTFMQAIKDYGAGFDDNFLNSRDVSAIAPNFKLQNTIPIPYTSTEQLASYANQPNTYVVLDVFHPGEHHVAVDHVEGDKIYMFDPGDYGNEVFSANWGGNLTISGFSVYKVE